MRKVKSCTYKNTYRMVILKPSLLRMTSNFGSCKEGGWLTEVFVQEGNLILLQYNLFERWAGWGEIAAVLDFRRIEEVLPATLTTIVLSKECWAGKACTIQYRGQHVGCGGVERRGLDVSFIIIHYTCHEFGRHLGSLSRLDCKKARQSSIVFRFVYSFIQ